MKSYLFEKYQSIKSSLLEELSLSNVMLLPRLEKVVINMGVGRATQDKNLLPAVAQDLALISGQRPILTKARKAESSFKIRQGMAIGCKVTLRRYRMYVFLEKLIAITIPQLRDFRGMNSKSFDKFGNYTFGLDQQSLFEEVNPDKIYRNQGMDITICIHNGSFKSSYTLLKNLGFPLKKLDIQ